MTDVPASLSERFSTRRANGLHCRPELFDYDRTLDSSAFTGRPAMVHGCTLGVRRMRKV